MHLIIWESESQGASNPKSLRCCSLEAEYVSPGHIVTQGTIVTFGAGG